MLGEEVRLTAGVEVLDLPGTPGDRLYPVYSGLLAGGVVLVGVVSLTDRVASTRALGSRGEDGEIRTGDAARARELSPTLTGVVPVLGPGLMRIVGAGTRARLGGTTELRILVRLDSAAPRIPGYVLARLGGTIVLILEDRLDGAVVIKELRERGDTSVGRVVRTGADALVGTVRVTVFAAGREMFTGAVMVRDFGAAAGARAGTLTGSDFWTLGDETGAVDTRERGEGTVALSSSLLLSRTLLRLTITAAGDKNRGSRNSLPECSTDNPRAPFPLSAACALGRHANKTEQLTIPINSVLICLSSCQPHLSNIPLEEAVRQPVFASSMYLTQPTDVFFNPAALPVSPRRRSLFPLQKTFLLKTDAERL